MPKKTRNFLRRAHLSNLFNLLQITLRERNYCRANRIIEILLQCPEIDISLIWQYAVDILTHLGRPERDCIEFFNQLLLHTKNAEDILLELIFYQIKYGQAEEALVTLETYLPQSPYNENPLFHGYTGMLAFSLWDQSNITNIFPFSNKRKRGLNEDEYILNGDHILEQQMRYYNLSVRSLKIALDKDIKNDMFLLLLANEETEEIDEALRSIEDFCKENSEWVNAGKVYHQVDPLSPPESALDILINYYENVIIIEQTSEGNQRNLVFAHYNIVELLFQRIEHGDDKISYFKKLIIHFIWLEFLDPSYMMINSLLKSRVSWIHSFIWCQALHLLPSETPQNYQTTINEDHLGLYRLLAILIENCSHESESHEGIDIKNFKDAVLSIKVEKRGERNSDQSENKIIGNVQVESDLNDIFNDILIQINNK
ncbi:10703_t:CDS:2 [Diversispora eburnea]|uniref:10703_t:CDS:1 n=1 Tax=Diversispora eburnea TaxID=1213867 RepID=A0A9N8UZI3_9GLOM|nr:10703_t:CDS:2 [Diversispora eburnea]